MTGSSSSPELSVVIPTHRRPALLERLLHSLARQSLAQDRFEAVVVNDASRDSTSGVLEYARGFLPSLRWSSFDNGRGPAAARNRGVEMSMGKLILFLDDDVEAEPDLLETHLGLHLESGDPLLGVLGRVDWDPTLQVTPFMRWLDASGLQFAYETWLRPGSVDPPYAAFYTANLSLGRDLLDQAGGFDERFPYPAYEDMELAWRLSKLGFRMDYRPEALVYHTRAIDLATFKSRMARVAESAVLLEHVQPDFPLSASYTPERWKVPGRMRRTRAALAARMTPSQVRLKRHYQTEIAASYQAGLRRGRARLREAADVSTTATR